MTVKVEDWPAVTVPRVGDAETEKSAKKTVKARFAVCAPLVPATEKFKGLALAAESPVTVTVLLCPAVIDEGLKEQLAGAQESVMLLMKELGAVADTVKVADVVPMTITVDRVPAEREKTGFPVPLSLTVCGLPAASSLRVSIPVRLPVPVGVKVMLTVQLFPTLRNVGRVPQVLVWEKSPVMLMPVRFTTVCPVLVSRTI